MCCVTPACEAGAAGFRSVGQGCQGEVVQTAVSDASLEQRELVDGEGEGPSLLFGQDEEVDEVGELDLHVRFLCCRVSVSLVDRVVAGVETAKAKDSLVLGASDCPSEVRRDRVRFARGVSEGVDLEDDGSTVEFVVR